MDYGFRLVGLGAAGVGRGATGRRLSFKLLLVVREFVFLGSLRFTLARGVAFAFSPAAFAFGLLAFAGRFAFAFVLLFPFVLPFAFSFLFFGLLGLFSFADAFVLRFSLDSSGGVTISGDSPAFVGRLTSIATV